MARLFNGSDQYLEASFSAFTVEPFTLAARFRKDAVSEKSILSVANTGNADYFSLHIGSTGELFALAWGGSYAFSAGAISVDTWYSGVAVFAADDDKRAYLDNDKGTNSEAETISTINNVRIGVTADTSPFGQFDGQIADAAMWNVALTDAEVASLAAGYSPLMIRPGSIVFYVPLVRDNDQDIVGGLSLTPINAPTIAAQPPVIYPWHPQSIIPAADTGLTITLDTA